MIPLLAIDNALTVIDAKHLSIHFPFEAYGKVSHCSGLKLAFLYQPKNEELHEFLLSQLYFESLKPFHLEMMCFIGKYVGTKNKYF